MALFAIAIPVPADKKAQWQEFVGKLSGERHDDFAASRRRLGVRERTFHQQTPMGDFVIVTLEGDDPAAAFQGFAQGSDEFSEWFRQQVQEIHGFDLRQPPPGPLPELIADSGPAS